MTNHFGQISIFLDNGAGLPFDAELRRSKEYGFPECGDLKIITKDAGTSQGNPIVMIAFTIDMNGQKVPVQAVTTAKLFVGAARAIHAKYGDLLK